MADELPVNTYKEITTVVERLHRRYLDVLRTKLNRERVDDLNAVQVNLMINIGEEEVVIRDLIERGYYLGSNVSYNLKKLVEAGYLEQERSQVDKRSVRVRVSEKGKAVCALVLDLENRLSKDLGKTEEGENFQNTLDVLREVERIWADYIHYGGK